MPPSRWFALTLVIASWAPGLSAQDVEMLGQRHGTRPPDGYYRELAQNPDAYRFTRGRAARLRELMEQSAAEAVAAAAVVAAAVMAAAAVAAAATEPTRSFA
jgi:hypothetical protein